MFQIGGVSGPYWGFNNRLCCFDLSLELFLTLPDPLVDLGVLKLESAGHRADPLRVPVWVLTVLILQDFSLLARESCMAQSRDPEMVSAYVRVLIFHRNFLRWGCFLFLIELIFQILKLTALIGDVHLSFIRLGACLLRERKINLLLRRGLFRDRRPVVLKAVADHCVPGLLELFYGGLKRSYLLNA